MSALQRNALWRARADRYRDAGMSALTSGRLSRYTRCNAHEAQCRAMAIRELRGAV